MRRGQFLTVDGHRMVGLLCLRRLGMADSPDLAVMVIVPAEHEGIGPEIARSMYLSQSTVRNHLTAVYRKFGVHSQRELLELLTSTAHPPT